MCGGRTRATSGGVKSAGLSGCSRALQTNMDSMHNFLGGEYQWGPSRFMDADGGFHFDLGDRRVNWNHCQWVVCRFAQALSVAAASRLILRVSTTQPREDIGVMVGLQRQGQCWYAHSWACSLAQGVNQGSVAIADFRPAEWYAPGGESHVDGVGYMDGQGLSAIAIGVCDARAKGVVSFRLEACACSSGPLLTAEDPVVSVTGQWLRVNGTEMVPPGVFGSFNLPAGHIARYRLGSSRRIEHTGLVADYRGPQEGEAVVIHTMGDRVRPSPRLTHADWQQRSAQAGHDLARQALAQGHHAVVEYWNEPYLNWANRNRANFIPALFDVEAACEGGQAHIAHDGYAVPGLRWTKDYHVPAWAWSSPRDWRRGIDNDGGWYSPVHAPPYKGMDAVYGGSWQPRFHPQTNLQEGDSYEVVSDDQALTLRVATPWHLYDESQFTHWSGTAMVPLYTEPGLALTKALKQADPDSTVIIGWGNRPSEDHWAAWELLYRPTIDAMIEVADGICDHDYGGDPTKMAAVYELVNAYSQTTYGKALTGWNTECAAATDPQAVPEADQQTSGASADLRKCRWTMRKIVHSLACVPDKARNCAHFGYGGSWWSDSGEGVAMDCLRALRGRLLHVECHHPHIWAVAAVDGIDPASPRPDDLGPGKDVVIAVLNDGSVEQDIGLQVAPPNGGRLLSGQLLRACPTAGGTMRTVVEPLAVDHGRSSVVLHCAPGEVVVVRFPAAGIEEGGSVVQRTQCYAPDILYEVSASHTLQTQVVVPDSVPHKLKSLTLRLAVEHLGSDAGLLHFNDEPFTLPACPTAENGARVVELKLPTQCLRTVNQLRFSLVDETRPGYRVVCCSLLLDHLIEEGIG